jgi:hypothetical protein
MNVAAFAVLIRWYRKEEKTHTGIAPVLCGYKEEQEKEEIAALVSSITVVEERNDELNFLWWNLKKKFLIF